MLWPDCGHLWHGTTPSKWRSESQAKNDLKYVLQRRRWYGGRARGRSRWEVSSLPPPHFPLPHLWGKIWHDVGAAALQWQSAWANVCPVFGQSSSERNIDTSSNKHSLYLAIKKLKLKSPIMVKMRNKKKYWLRSSQQVITGRASRAEISTQTYQEYNDNTKDRTGADIFFCYLSSCD